jgi:hypothetical protein
MTTATRWAFESADFRRTAYRLTQHDGRSWLMAECESFEGGRWEGFVSMVPDTPEARWTLRYGQEGA